MNTLKMMNVKGMAKMSFREKLAGMNNHYRYYELEYFFQQLNLHDIHYAELWTGPMHFFVDYHKHDDIDFLKKLEAKYDVKIIGICPEQTNPKANHIASKHRQQDIYQYYCNMIDIAKKIGCNQVLITSGWAFYNEDKGMAWKRSVDMMKHICSYAHEQGVIIVMEALQPEESILVNSVKDLKKYKLEVDHDCLKICIDFGAMARAENTLQDYFDAFDKDIVHIHFVDGAPCGHLAWGDGKRDLQADLTILNERQYHGYLSLETAASRYFQTPWIAEETTLRSFELLGGAL